MTQIQTQIQTQVLVQHKYKKGNTLEGRLQWNCEDPSHGDEKQPNQPGSHLLLTSRFLHPHNNPHLSKDHLPVCQQKKVNMPHQRLVSD